MAENSTAPASPAVYFNGRILPAAEAHLPIDDAGTLYGLGFFETFRTSGGRPHQWDFHRARMAQACITAGITMPPTFLVCDEARLRETVRVLLREHGMSDGVFRYTLTAGRASAPDSRGEGFSEPAEFMVLRALPPCPPPEGVALRVLQLSRDNGEWLPRPKSLNYANAFAGAGELRRRGAAPGDEGLFLSREGAYAVETPRQNLAWIEGERLCYPDPALGAVAGTCLQWALQLGLPFAARRARLPDLLGADAIMVLNAVRGVTPVREAWDAQDQHRFRLLESHAHPLVVSLVGRWSDALRATARG